MLSVLKANGSEMPIFITDDERQSLTVRIPIHERFRSSELRANYSVRKTQDELRRSVLALLSNGAKSRREILHEMGYANISKTFIKVIDSMIQEGLISQTGKGRSSKLSLR